MTPHHRAQAGMGVAVLAAGALMAWGALDISSDAGYTGVGPNALPWVVAAALLLCGLLLLVQACTGGYRQAEPPSGGERGDWPSLAWMAAGVLVNAATITTVGFVLACALCYALAVRGLRQAEGHAHGGLRGALTDLAVGLAIAAPVYWIFSQLLNISLPSLTGTGWL